MKRRLLISFAKWSGYFAIVSASIGCGSSDDEQSAKTNHCTFTIAGDDAAGLGSRTLEVDSPIPYQGDEMGPLVIGTAQGAKSSFECGQRGPLESTPALSAYFEIGWTNTTNALEPFDVTMSRIDEVTSLNVRVQNAQQAYGKCSVGSFRLTSAELVLNDASTRWYKVHGAGSAECEGENGAPGRVQLGLTF